MLPIFKALFLATLPVLDGWLVILEEAVELSLLADDYDNDGQVNSGDLDLWEETYGTWNSEPGRFEQRQSGRRVRP